MPETTLLEALELAHREIKKLCEAQEELRERAGKPKWLDPDVTAELEQQHRARSASGSAPRGCVPPTRVVEELLPELSMDSTEDDVQLRCSAS